MEDNGMIPMAEQEEIELPDGPPTAKARNAVQQEVNRLLDALAPDRAMQRAGGKPVDVERYRTPRGCVLQARAGAVTVSWFPDSAQGAELGELQVMAWRGTVSRPGSSQRTAGAEMVEELVLRPGEDRMGAGLVWRTTTGQTYSSDALAGYCGNLLEQWTVKAAEPE